MLHRAILLSSTVAASLLALGLSFGLGEAQTLKLSNERTPAEALKAYTTQDACEKHYAFRTIDVYLENDTPANVEIAFFQVQDTSGQVPEGFSTDTGVYVAVTGGAANSTYHTDPCRAGGRNQPIQGTRFSGSAKFTYGGQSADITLDTIEAEQGNYYGTAGWKVSIDQIARHFPTIKQDMLKNNQRKKERPR